MDKNAGTLQFLVNGKCVTYAPCSPQTTLIQYLRKNRLTGTKLSCGEGNCGSCTVLITRRKGAEFDRYTVNACTTLLCTLNGTEVTTIEGLGSTKSCLHPIQERLFSCHGSQCGFCSPGMVMSMAGVLCKHPTPDIEDILTGLQGNLCRCTGYRPILEAFSTFASTPLEKGVRTVDANTEEVATYDISKFQELSTTDLEVTEETKAKLDSIKQVGCIEFEGGLKWFHPTTVKEAQQLFQEFPGAVYRQGGTGGYKRFLKVPEPSTVISLTSIQELKGIEERADGVFIKAGVTYSELIIGLGRFQSPQHQALKVLKTAVENIASAQLRNEATLVGGILWGHPASDVVPLLTVAAAVIYLETAGGQSTLEVSPGVNSLLKPGDLVTGVFVPNNKETEVIAFKKHARRKTVELAILNLALFFSPGSKEQPRIVIGGIDLAVAGIKQKNAIKAVHLEELVAQNGLAIVSQESVSDAIAKDLGKSCTPFKIKMIQEMISSITESSVVNKVNLKAHQLFEKTSSDQSPTDPITRPVPHISAAEQCTGEAVYVDDIPSIDGELLLFPVHSSEAHARIISVDYQNALNIPGVASWIAAEDISGLNRWSINGIPEEVLFPEDKVEYYGQIIGVVAAKTREAGKAAVALVKVQYEKLPAIVNIPDAIKEDSYFVAKSKLERLQDPDLQKSSSKIVHGGIKLGGQEHFYLETHSAFAVPSTEKDEMVLYFTTQEPNTVQTQVCCVLGIPQNRVVVKTKRVGGAFGGKERCFVALMAAVAAKKLGLPCRFVLDRPADVATTGHRHEVDASYTVAYNDKGMITNARFHCDFNAGFSNDLSVVWGHVIISRMDGGYTLKNFSATAVPRKTNLSSSAPFRGFGGPEGCLIIEDAIEKIAHELKVDPAVVRRNNLTREKDLLHHGDFPVQDDNLLRCWNECIEKSNYFVKKAEIDEFNKDPKNGDLKRGISIIPIKFATTIPSKFLNQASAFVRIYVDGSVLLSHGGVEMGQGLHTKMVQVASKVLKIPMSKIHIMETSTETNPNATATGGSSGTDLNGHAVVNACQTLVERLAPIRDSQPDLPWEKVVMQAYFQRIPLSAFGFYNTSEVHFDFETNSGTMFNYLTNGVACTQVEIDASTGEHAVLSVDIVMDVGASLNPAIDIGQIEGAFLQGYGYVTMEEMLHGRDGAILTDNFGTYNIPTITDIPQELNVSLLRNSRGHKEAVFSSKGIGEPPINLSVSVVTALRQAVSSYRQQRGLDPWFTVRIPFTTQRIFKACHGIPDEDDPSDPWFHL